VTGLGVAHRLRWTPVQSALALFVGVQVLTTLVNAGPWPQELAAKHSVRGEVDVSQTSSLTTPLLAIGAGLCFVYQFTHGL